MERKCAGRLGVGLDNFFFFFFFFLGGGKVQKEILIGRCASK